MPARAECDCTAQLLRSIRALHVLHRNAQRSHASRRNARFDEFTYLRAVVVVVDGAVVVVVGVVSCALSFTGPIGCATR